MGSSATPASGPTFSVIVPTRDRPNELRRCLAALSELDYPREEYEIVIVDDGTRKGDVEPVLGTAGGSVRVVRSDGTGPAHARNVGAAEAKGRYLAFTDDDCEADTRWLRAFERRLSADAASAVAGLARNRLEGNRYSAASQLLIEYLHDYYNHEPERAHFGTANNLTVSARAFEEVGGFDERFVRVGGEDRELCWRVGTNGKRLVFEPNAVVYHAHALDLASFWRQQFTYGRGAVGFHRSCGLEFEPAPFYARLLTYPWRKRAQEPGRLAALLAVSQAANAAGWAYEIAAERRKAAKARRSET